MEKDETNPTDRRHYPVCIKSQRNHKRTTRINEVSKVAGYNINRQNQLCFYTPTMKIFKKNLKILTSL